MASDGAGVGGLAARYASALYDLADESAALDAVAADLTGLDALILESADFARFIKSPVLNRADQAKGLAAIATKAGLSDITTKFLGLVASNRRGLVTAEVTSAAALSDGQSKSLLEALKAAVGTSVAVTTKVDPTILGGLIVRVGSRMVDSSLKSKLQRLKLSMKGVG
jgi:F-type H+-transporting ATPase subunit delta